MEIACIGKIGPRRKMISFVASCFRVDLMVFTAFRPEHDRYLSGVGDRKTRKFGFEFTGVSLRLILLVGYKIIPLTCPKQGGRCWRFFYQ